MKTGKTLMELAQEVDRQSKIKKDFLIDTRNLSLNAKSDGKLSLNMAGADYEPLVPNDIFHRQIGQTLNIPAKYYEKMRMEYPDLLVQNVNGWFEKNPLNRMVRTLDGTARAFLSERYRRIDNYEILETVLPVIQGMQGAQIESCEITERKMYLKVVNPRLEREISPGDIVQAGIVISNSEVGHGSVSVQPLIYRLVYSNGLIVNDAGTRKYHIGRGNSANENYELFTDETIRADDRAFMMKIQDTVHAAVDEVKFEFVIKQMRQAKEVRITSTDIPQVVELAGKEFGFTLEENKGILDHLIRGGEFNLYGLSNAVTRFSQDVSGYDRATELESAGYDVLTMKPRQWKQINLETAA